MAYRETCAVTHNDAIAFPDLLLRLLLVARSCRYDGAVVSALKAGGTMPDEMPAHRPLQMSRSQTEEIVDALKQCIDAHGPITRRNLSSAKQAGPAGRQR